MKVSGMTRKSEFARARVARRNAEKVRNDLHAAVRDENFKAKVGTFRMASLGVGAWFSGSVVVFFLAIFGPFLPAWLYISGISIVVAGYKGVGLWRRGVPRAVVVEAEHSSEAEVKAELDEEMAFLLELKADEARNSWFAGGVRAVTVEELVAESLADWRIEIIAAIAAKDEFYVAAAPMRAELEAERKTSKRLKFWLGVVVYVAVMLYFWGVGKDERNDYVPDDGGLVCYETGRGIDCY